MVYDNSLVRITVGKGIFEVLTNPTWLTSRKEMYTNSR